MSITVRIINISNASGHCREELNDTVRELEYEISGALARSSALGRITLFVFGDDL
jgi:hypothetical protein